MISIKKVLVFGGTHGNEWTGIFAIKKYQDQLQKEFPELKLEFIHANPEAYRINKRFKDEDLNRAFQFLNEDRKGSYEHDRAKDLLTIILKEECFIVDLHTTTSNMGNTIIVTQDEKLNYQTASHLISKLKNTKIIVSPDPQKKYLASQSPYGLMIEVGPVANSVIHPVVLENTLELLREVLKSLSTPHNLTTTSLEIYEECEDVFYPQNESGEIEAYVHSELQGKDFLPLEGKYKAFKTFDGVDQERETIEKLYPIFINEAAYYPSKLAFTLCRKKTLNI